MLKVGVIVGATCVAFLIAYLLLPPENEDPGGSRSAVAGDPDTPPYPDEWKTTLEQAASRVSFPVFIPDTTSANVQNIQAVYVYPENEAVAIDFPAARQPEAPVRQEYIEVWQSAWAGGDPVPSFKEDIADDPGAGYVLLDLQEGITGLGVPAHSPSDDDRANPAFVRFVFHGVDFHISGGESLDALIEIANSLIVQEPVAT